MRKNREALLTGDAAAVGDPFMGEGIGRALGSGPMIYEALKKIPASQLTFEKLSSAYVKLWEKNYSSRLKLGFALRWLLGKKSILFPALVGILKTEGILNRLTPSFHKGFPTSS